MRPGGRAAVLLWLAGATGCELTETTAVDPPVLPVVEMILRSGTPLQSAYLHRAGPPDAGGRAVPGAHIVVAPFTGVVAPPVVLGEVDLPFCVVFWRASFDLADGTCYASVGSEERPVPGASYDLRVTLPGGGRMTGRTTVPGGFRVVSPAAAPDTCALAAGESMELAWTRSEGAWSYVVEAHLHGLREALAPRGIDIQDEPFFLRGVAVSAGDTTLAFPSALGVFDRLDLPRDLLLELQRGLPAGVTAEVTVAAVDRNYVNWARGGGFHPSGRVRVPSVRGAGTGVFGSAVERTLVARVGGAGRHPPCVP